MNKAAFSHLRAALFSLAAAVASDTSSAAVGDLYATAAYSNQIVKITPAGVKTPFATATFPRNIAFDAAGNLYVSQFVNPGNTNTNLILKITPAGVKTTFVSGLGGPNGLAFDASGNLFVCDGDIKKITPSGTKSTFASDDRAPVYLAFDGSGNLFVALANSAQILKITPTGVKSVFAEDGYADGLAFDASGNLFATYLQGPLINTGTVLKYAPNGSKSTFALTSSDYPDGVAVDSLGNVFVGYASDNIFKYTPTGVKSTFATGVHGIYDLAFEPPTGTLANISTRASVKTGNRVLIAGFIVMGAGPKQVIIRGLGPTLANFGVTNVLQNPVLQLSNGASVVAANDDWQNAANAGQIPTSPVDYRPPNSKESAILATLQPGSYTATLSGSGSTTGNGLIEVYDLSQAGTSQLANISTRGFVGAGDNIMSAGIIANGGNGSIKVMVRALGPTLRQFGLSGVLADPMLTLVDANGNVVAFNDNWKNTQQPVIQSSSLAPPNDLESAILSTLTNGNYTAVVSGKNNGTGVALVEMYKQQ